MDFFSTLLALMKLHAVFYQGYAFWLFLTSRHLMFAPWSLVLLLNAVLLVLKCRCLDCRWIYSPIAFQVDPALRFAIRADELHSHQIHIDAVDSAYIHSRQVRCPTCWMLAPNACVCFSKLQARWWFHGCIGSCHHRYWKINRKNIWKFGGCRWKTWECGKCSLSRWHLSPFSCCCVQRSCFANQLMLIHLRSKRLRALVQWQE